MSQTTEVQVITIGIKRSGLTQKQQEWFDHLAAASPEKTNENGYKVVNLDSIEYIPEIQYTMDFRIQTRECLEQILFREAMRYWQDFD